MTHHKKNQKHCKKDCKKDCKKELKSKYVSKSELISTNSKSHPHHHSHPHPHSYCVCEQLFYSPLPNLPSRPPTQTVTPGEWFAPDSVQSCCSICSSVKPVYETPCTGYCCKQY